ncbi:MAG: hypothetical protein WBV73_18145 [Phormidium sp.]
MPLPEHLNSADLQPFLENSELLASESRELQLAIANHPTTPRCHLGNPISTDRGVVRSAIAFIVWI